MWRYHHHKTPRGIHPARTYREVGEIVGLTPGGVKQIESRAIAKLQKHLRENPGLRESLEMELDALSRG